MASKQYEQIKTDLWIEQSKTDPDPAVCYTLLEELNRAMLSTKSNDETDCCLLTKLITACQKTFRLQRRRAQSNDPWDDLLKLTMEVVGTQRKRVSRVDANKAAIGTKVNANDDNDDDDNEAGLPGNISQYLHRLKRHKKDLYKNPPALPPNAVIIYEERAPLSKRDSKTGQWKFDAGNHKDIDQWIREFHPNTTPEEILRGGAFGGTYFRPIHSAVTNCFYRSRDVLNDTVLPSWIEGLDLKQFLTRSDYNSAVNKFGVSCGGSLGMWESSGWISDVDPYGWFQWYCRFFQGRRCSDDVRQIKRWLGVAGSKGRFKSQLCNKILAAGGMAKLNDTSISPVIRQSLFHWGLEITEYVLQQHMRRK